VGAHSLRDRSRRPSSRNLRQVTAILRRFVVPAGRVLAGVLIVVGGLLAGFGWLYVLRGLGWLGLGPRIADSLPLLQLAGFDGQPLLRVLVAWVLAGALAGIALGGVRTERRLALTAIAGLALLLIGAQAAYALARNLAFSSVLFSRTPGLGPVLEGLAFALGSVLPRRLAGRHRVGLHRSLVARIGGFDDRRLRGG
jgi:hypothetical protein